MDTTALNTSNQLGLHESDYSQNIAHKRKRKDDVVMAFPSSDNHKEDESNSLVVEHANEPLDLPVSDNQPTSFYENYLRGPAVRGDWLNIFAPMKLIVSMRVYQQTASNSEADLCIRFVDDNFLESFKFEFRSIQNRCIEALVGPATSRATLRKIKEDMHLGHQSEGEFINLYRKDKEPLSCFVRIHVLSASVPSTAMMSANVEHHLLGVMTVRSASAVGNAKYCGLGLLDNHQLSTDDKAVILHRKVAEQSRHLKGRK